MKLIAPPTMPDLNTQSIPSSEQGFALVFERNPTPMWVVDLDRHRFLAVNAAAVAEYGYPPETFLTLTIRDVYGEADLPRFDEGVTTGAQDLYSGLWVHRRQDGTSLNVEIRSNDLLFQGHRARLIHVTNITEALRIEAARKAGETLRTAILDSVLDCIVTMDAEGRTIEFNAAAERTFGYTKAQAIGRPLAELIVPPRFRDAHNAGLARYLALGEATVIGRLLEMTAVRSDGVEIPVELTITVVRSEQGPIFTGVLRDITARKQADESRARLAAIVESSDDGIIGKDLDGIITSWNSGAAKIFGYSASEMVGKSMMRLMPADRRDEEQQILGTIRRNESVRHLETQRARKDGRLIDVSITISPIKDATGQVIGSSKVVRDITERKRADEARLASEARYRALFEYAPDGILIADRDSRFIDANARMSQMIGYPCDELIGMQASDIVPHAEVEHIAPALDVITGTADYHREWRLRRKDGSTFPADVIATVMPDGNLLGMVRDVSERNRATEALRRAEERTRFALEAAGVGIWDLDFKTGVLQWSEILESQYGLQPGTFGGTFDAFLDRVHPHDREALLESMMRPRSDANFSMQHRALMPDGSMRWLSGAGRIHLDEHGAPVRGVGISMDVTGRHTLEQQFQQAQKMEAIGRLAGGVAHDFNNLLTAILGYCELLLDDFDPADPRRADISEIQKAGQRAAGLTRQLLAFSRKQIIEPTLLDLNVVVADVQPMIERLIGDDVTVVLELGPEPMLVHADRGQIDQIIVNLAVNARDAMPTGGRLTIRTRHNELDEHDAATPHATTPGSCVLLTVTDTGTGMTPEVQARLFEPFFTTKEPGKGTGLGLATVYGIVSRTGGSVGVCSEVGLGTSFKLYFPRAAAVATAVEVPTPAVRAHAGGETALVVDDDEGLRELAKRLLDRQGYKVLLAANADEALQVLDASGSIDVLLADVVMPGASGPELARRVIQRSPAVKVIYMSGYTEDAIVHHGILEPGVEFLHKPFTSETIGRKFREVLDR